MTISAEARTLLAQLQRTEITEYHVYRRLAQTLPESENRRILERIADDERRHARLWEKYLAQQPTPDPLRLWWYYGLGRLLGLTFSIKLMERGEQHASRFYQRLATEIPEAEQVAREEDSHEQALIALLDEDRLRYTGAMVLGLNDALVELTGAVAGLTLALQNTRLIAMTALITGVAAAMSMAASSYLSARAEPDQQKNPLKSAAYTGVAYLLTVALLIAPYLLFQNYYVCLALTLAAALLIIAAFNYYICVARELSFRQRFLEMSTLSFGVAAISFLLGFLLRKLLGVEI
ncbi:MAG: VIT1/CCC1 transporter family protein [Verrucomicrobiae bacterium]|nr:VIT1/CCC1 transporter family protein [Verrucomicrobiae bacterium]